MRPARAPGRAGGRPARQQGRARCVRVLIVAAARRRRGSAVWRPPRTHPPGTGRPGVVTGSGLGLAPPSHASPGDGAPRDRHRVGTKHTRWWRLQGVHGHGQCCLAPPRTHSPRTGHPGVVTGSGLSTHGELRPRGAWRHGQQAGGGACQASGEGGGGETRCVVRVRCRQRGRQSCGMPLILERREHPGTFLGVVCPSERDLNPLAHGFSPCRAYVSGPEGVRLNATNGGRPPRQTVTGESGGTWDRGVQQQRVRARPMAYGAP